MPIEEKGIIKPKFWEKQGDPKYLNMFDKIASKKLTETEKEAILKPHT